MLARPYAVLFLRNRVVQQGQSGGSTAGFAVRNVFEVPSRRPDENSSCVLPLVKVSSRYRLIILVVASCVQASMPIEGRLMFFRVEPHCHRPWSLSSWPAQETDDVSSDHNSRMRGNGCRSLTWCAVPVPVPVPSICFRLFFVRFST